MKTIQLNLYQYNELNKDAKEKAREWIYKGAMELFADDFTNDFTENCPKWVISPKPLFSFSSCQGDGFSFECESINVEHFLAEMKTSVKKAIKERLRVWSDGNTGRYTFASEKDIDYEMNDYSIYPLLDKKCLEIVEKIRMAYVELCKEWEKIGYNQLDYLKRDEYCAVAAAANDYWFTEKGIHFLFKVT